MKFLNAPSLMPCSKNAPIAEGIIKECLLWVISGSQRGHKGCPLLEVERTLIWNDGMFVICQERTWHDRIALVAE
jgi:hypothetical protein